MLNLVMQPTNSAPRIPKPTYNAPINSKRGNEGEALQDKQVKKL